MLTSFLRRLPLRNPAAVTARLTGFWPKMPTLSTGAPAKYFTSAAASDKRALILGCGYMSGPLIEYLAQYTECDLTIGTRMQSGPESVSDKLSSLDLKGRDITVKQVDVTDSAALGQLMKDKDLCISFATTDVHFHALKQCLAHGVDLVTPSYPCPQFLKLGKEAAARGITVICEQGCDPGIDHMLAMEYIDRVHAQGGKVESYIMYCDGVPAPEDADNALKYKVCWDPQRVLRNTLNPARYLENGKVVDVPAGGDMLKMARTVTLGEYEFEGTPSRDSLRYISIFGIEGVKTLVRGLYKHKGYAERMAGLQRIGVISETKHPSLKGDMTWREIMCTLLNVSPSGVEEALRQRVNGNKNVLQTVQELGLLSDTIVPMSETVLETFANYLKTKIPYKPGEREWLILWQQIESSYGNKKERCTNVLESYGYPTGGHSASAYTTALPPAITARMILEGKLKKPGMHYPVTSDIYKPVLAELKAVSASWGTWTSSIEEIE